MSRAVPVERDGREEGWAFLNVQGIRNKQCELWDLLRGQRIGLLGLAETWLLPGDDINVEGFKWVGGAWEGGLGRGGVDMFVQDTYAVVEEKVEDLGTGVESVWARISGEGITETLVGVVKCWWVRGIG